MIVFEMGGGHRDRLIGIMREDCKGTSGIKTNSPDRVSIYVVLGQYSLKGDANGIPDIIGGLFLEIRSTVNTA